MKKISLLILLFSTLMQAQHQPEYSKLWKQVKQFDKENLPKSANEVVITIFNTAKAEHNTQQLVKALLFQSKYTLTLEENAQLKIIKHFLNEIETASFPEKNILENLLANMYWQYFQQHRWQYYKRSNIDKKDNVSDFRTWDLHTIFKEIDLHFQNSLHDAVLAQTTPISDFELLLEIPKGSDTFRPSLFDFLAHNALSFYKTGESNLPQPAYKFELDKHEFLGTTMQFLEADFSSKDSSSQKRKALLLYKELMQFHKNKKQLEALIDVSLQRLDFVKSNAVFPDKETVYLGALNQMKKKYESTPYATEIDYRIALHFQSLGQTYHAKTHPENRNCLKKAVSICEEAIARFPNSNGAIKCRNLKNRIRHTSYTLTVEQNIEVEKESRLLLKYRNADTLYFRVYQSGSTSEDKLQREYNKVNKLNYIKRMKEVLSFDTVLRNEGDYQLHTTEMILPKLQQGSYVILASEQKDFNNSEAFSYAFVQVTNLVLINNNKDNVYSFQVVNRYTGKPVKAAKVHLYNKDSRYNKALDTELITDNEGFAMFSPDTNYNRVTIKVTHDNDLGVFKYYSFYQPYAARPGRPYHNETVFLFTDRSIYRPSQTVYFKGIAVSQRDNSSHVIANKAVKVELRDVNHQVLQTLELQTNEFGSFSASFILPNAGLTGNYQINVSNSDKKSVLDRVRTMNRDIYGSVNFSVEEYKRPKFEVAFDKVTESFQLNDSVTVKAIAKAYAGSNITDAKVVYRVSRKVQYPNWWYWYRPYFSSEAQEIVHGETITNDKGEFEITFLAQPDLSIEAKDSPVFHYEVIADVTDINGETRSTTTVVRVGYHTLQAQLQVDQKLDKDKKDHKVSFTTKNLNGEVVNAQGFVKIYKLKAPSNVYRTRPWDSPDYQSIEKSTFQRLFPHDSYNNTNNVYSWKKGELVFERAFDTAKDTAFVLKKTKNWESGKYLTVLETKDRYNQDITAKQIFEIFSQSDKEVSDLQLFTISLDKKDYQPGDTAYLKIGTASKDMSVVVRVEKNHKEVSKQLLHLNNELKTIPLQITQDDLGGFGITYYFVNYNSFSSGSLVVPVPYPKTDLEIETRTFRDKLQPGQEETWSFKIKGPKGDKVMAELLTGMYDASLDQFKPHAWSFYPITYSYYHVRSRDGAGNSFGTRDFNTFLESLSSLPVRYQDYAHFNWHGFRFGNVYLRSKMSGEVRMMKNVAPVASEPLMEMDSVDMIAEESEVVAESFGANIESQDIKNSVENPKEEKAKFSDVKVRTNFNETAFFFPQLTTDLAGNVSFSFTTPESLTKWKLQLLAHTKDLKSSVETLEAVTQKELMILPNPPRFLREGDEIVFTSKLSNLTDQNIEADVVLQLFDAITNQPIDSKLGNNNAQHSIHVEAQANADTSWILKIPSDVQAVLYKIVAISGSHSDGEQNVLPVLSNRMLVTETLPMWVRSHETKHFTLDRLKENTSSSLKHHKLTLEITSNPAWYAVQALPYLMEYPYECAEQTFSRYYANTLASYIANSNPRIQYVFDQWRNTDALLSNLEKNQELKSIIINETPWLRDAQSETEQKKRIALLFDLHKMQSEQEQALKKLEQMQMSDGGFPWFKGSRYPNRYITQHIVAGYGHLKQLQVIDADSNMIRKAIDYLDNELQNDYEKLLEQARKIEQKTKSKRKGKRLAKDFLESNHTSHFQVHYLYARSFYTDQDVDKKYQDAFDYYTNQTYTYWQDYNLYSKGMIALLAHRNKNTVAKNIMASLKENSINSEELGMYWKANTSSYYWYQAPIETQALLIEAFAEVGTQIQSEEKNLEDVDNLKIWLLKNKQTNRWKTTKATSEAVYALLLQGTNWIETTTFIGIQVGDKVIKPLELEDCRVEAGTGYFKTSWHTEEITSDKAEISLSKQDEGIAWGAMYWQYFEDLDKITHVETPLQLTKKLFLKTNQDRGEQLTLISPDSTLHLGDLVRVRIELKVDRAMEFIHMKDMRASGFEPVNVLSQYKWQDGLGYYESTKDASTDFFIDYLPKGVFVFEYDLRVNNAGSFSNGITSIQSMYAPEFSSHSEGVRVQIEK